MRAFFVAQLGNVSTFQYWSDDWWTRGSLNETFPHLFVLSMNPGAIVVECWDGTWNLTLAGALSDQRVEEFLLMQLSLAHKRPQSRARDGSDWIGAQFSIPGAYKRLCEWNPEENLSIISACRFIWRQKVPLKVRSFGWLLL